MIDINNVEKIKINNQSIKELKINNKLIWSSKSIELNGFNFSDSIDKEIWRQNLYYPNIEGNYAFSVSFDVKIPLSNTIKLICGIDQKTNPNWHPNIMWGVGNASEFGEMIPFLDVEDIDNNWHHIIIYRYDLRRFGLDIDGSYYENSVTNSPIYNEFFIGAYGSNTEQILIKNIINESENI